METEKSEAQIKVRLPPDLKEWLKLQAMNSRRTLNNEILHRLERSKPPCTNEGPAA